LLTAGYRGLAPAPAAAPATRETALASATAEPACRAAGPSDAPEPDGNAPPMALAVTSANADPITARAIAGSAGQFDVPAADFTLTSQAGRPVSLSSLRGKVVLLTFLDPVCTTDCPLIAQEMRSADAMLGG